MNDKRKKKTFCAEKQNLYGTFVAERNKLDEICFHLGKQEKKLLGQNFLYKFNYHSRDAKANSVADICCLSANRRQTGAPQTSQLGMDKVVAFPKYAATHTFH